MKPTLFHIHLGSRDLSINSYGLLVAAGVALAVVWFVRRAKRAGLPGQRVVDLAFWALVLGLAGSRVLYVVLEARTFATACFERGDCAQALYFWEGGLVYQGGLIAGAITMFVFSRRQGWRWRQVADLLAPAVAAGHAVGRLGCFAAGCCFGKTGQVPWAVTFPRDSVAFQDLRASDAVSVLAPGTPPLHPTQLYEAIGELIVAGLLLVIGRRRKREGDVVLAYAALYGGLRFVVEAFRGDGDRGFVWSLATPALARFLGLPEAEPLFLSVPQLLCVVLLAIGLVGLARRPKPQLSQSSSS